MLQVTCQHWLLIAYLTVQARIFEILRIDRRFLLCKDLCRKYFPSFSAGMFITNPIARPRVSPDTVHWFPNGDHTVSTNAPRIDPAAWDASARALIFSSCIQYSNTSTPVRYLCGAPQLCLSCLLTALLQ